MLNEKVKVELEFGEYWNIRSALKMKIKRMEERTTYKVREQIRYEREEVKDLKKLVDKLVDAYRQETGGEGDIKYSEEKKE